MAGGGGGGGGGRGGKVMRVQESLNATVQNSRSVS